MINAHALHAVQTSIFELSESRLYQALVPSEWKLLAHKDLFRQIKN